MKLLISVIDPVECAAFTRWPDYLDVKNPSDGSLGMPRPGVVRRVREHVGAGVVVSAAIGDATDDSKLYSERAVSVAKEGADIIKVGLLDFPSRRSAVKFLQGISDALRAPGLGGKIVAAVYADLSSANVIRKLPRLARDAGAWGCLVDTYDKRKGSLLSHQGLGALKEFTTACRENGMIGALAGGLRIEDLKWLNDVAPDIVGFRSAVSSVSRSASGVDPKKLETLLSRFGRS